MRTAPQKTYSVAKPTSTHTRPASCDEVDCATQAGGFKVVADESDPTGSLRAQYLRSGGHGRVCTESREGTVAVFTFPPGQQCFTKTPHRVSLDRPEFYSVTDLGRRYTHSGADPWLNDCGDHLDYLRPHFG